MKKISMFSAIIALLINVSCAKETTQESFVNEGRLVVSATNDVQEDQDSKLYLTAPNTLKWTKQDKLIGINNAGNVYISEEKGGSTDLNGTFTFNTWSGTPAYFMSNYQANGVVYSGISVDNGNVVALIPSQQRYVDSTEKMIARECPVTIGIPENTGTLEEPAYTVTLKNVTAFATFTLSYVDDIKQIEVGSVEDIDIAGVIEISGTSIAEGTPVATIKQGEGSNTITLVPSNGAAHKVDGIDCFNLKTFYFSMLPSEFTPVITFTDHQGRTCTKTLPKKITTTRAKYYDLGVIDGSLNFDPALAQLPQTLTLNLGKNWNFIESAPVKDNYEKEEYGDRTKARYGETYNYRYSDESGFRTIFPFQICRHFSGSNVDGDTGKNTGYYYSDTEGLVFIGAGACLTLPAIPFYKLTSVELDCTKRVKLQTVFGYSNDASTLLCLFVPENDSGNPPLDPLSYYELTDPQVNTSYYLYFFTSTDINVSDLKLVYTRVEDLPTVVELGFDYALGGNPYTNVFTNLPLSTTAASDHIFYLEDGGYKFVSNKGSLWYWNKAYGLITNGAAPMYLKLPKLPGFRLSKVKFGTNQAKDKIVKISCAVGEVESAAGLTEIGNATLNNSVATVIVNDVVDPEKDYYYVTGSTSVGLCKFLLTYRPL